ncbi:hypothetical protein PT974_12107 [Cladobotryum mycophilum]|uniref:Uncharacterized protein n=1 Tax=Cladobotryum mycophilum TaxID=491253 RepID=A0ABR0S740_9HYPO
MITTSSGLIEHAETADEYGRREKCLRNHRRRPFCFEACIPYLQDAIQPTGKDRLVDQPGLRVFTPPQPNVILDSFDFRDAVVERFMALPQDPSLMNPPLIAGLDIYKDLLIPVESLDLGSNHEFDTRQYSKEVSAKRFSNPFDQWLPLSSVIVERDEGLPFPSHSSRLQSLLQREVDRERPISPNGASALEEEVHLSTWSTELEQHLYNSTKPKPAHRAYPESITPPISPISEDGLPFVPSNDGNIIDLTSEPNSPITEQARILQNNLERGCFDSEPAAPIFPISSPSQGLPDILRSSYQNLQDMRLDVPVVLTNSDALCDENVMANVCPRLANDEHLIDPPNGEESSYFEEAFSAIMNDRASYVDNLADQERLNPSDSISRISVPILNFDIPPPEWSTRCSTAKSHLCWLRDSLGSAFCIPIIPKDTKSEMGLKWTPVPPKSGRTVGTEELPCFMESARDLLEDVVPTWGNTSFLSIRQHMAILELAHDEEIEHPTQLSDDETQSSSSPRPTNQKELITDQTDSMQEGKSHYFPSQDWSTLIRSVKKRPIDIETSLLPRSMDTSATSSLIAGFMQLRGKKPRVNSPASTPSRKITVTTLPQARNHSSTVVKEQASPREVETPKVPAIAPKLELPAEKGTFIISLSLGRSIIAHLETMWPSGNLIDMDYSLYNTMAWSPNTGQQREVISILSYEADVSLSSSAGIVVTNLLRVRQRALPGSKAQAPLRERIAKVSQKYETLIVLVSETNPAGEFMASLNSSDAAAYADFVRFTTALDTDVNVCFVPGAEHTLAKWILSLMCQYSHQAVPLKRFLSIEESSWDLLLRRAGMNVTAAKVISVLLFEEFGPSGLAKFLISTIQERVDRYAALLGGERVMCRISERLDRKWS